MTETTDLVCSRSELFHSAGNLLNTCHMGSMTSHDHAIYYYHLLLKIHNVMSTTDLFAWEHVSPKFPLYSDIDISITDTAVR